MRTSIQYSKRHASFAAILAIVSALERENARLVKQLHIQHKTEKRHFYPGIPLS